MISTEPTSLLRHTQYFHPTSTDAVCDSVGQFDFSISTHSPLLIFGIGVFLFCLTLIRAAMSHLLFLCCYLIPLLLSQRKPAQKKKHSNTASSTAHGKRKCDDTNSTYEHTKQHRQPSTTEPPAGFCDGVFLLATCDCFPLPFYSFCSSLSLSFSFFFFAATEACTADEMGSIHGKWDSLMKQRGHKKREKSCLV